MKRIRLKKDWTAPDGTVHKAGTVLEVSATLANTLMTAKEGVVTAESYTDAEETAEKEATAREEKRIGDIAKAAVKELAETLKASTTKEPLLSIVVKDTKDNEDPSHGYCAPIVTGKRSKEDLAAGFGAFLADVYAAKDGGAVSPRLKASREKSEKMFKEQKGFLSDAAQKEPLSVTDVGYMVPPEFSTILLAGSVEAAKVRPRATRVDIMSNSIDLPYVEDYDHSAGLLYGGVAAFWTGESAQYTASKPKIGNVALKLNKLTALGYITEEVMRFSPVTMGTFLMPKFQDAIAWKEDLAFLYGTGAGMPLGIMNSKALLTIAKTANQPAKTILWSNVKNMLGRVKANSDADLVWFTNRQNFPHLASLKDDAGVAIWAAGGAGSYQGVGGAPARTLYGIPVEYGEKFEVAGEVGDLLLADLKQYMIADDRMGPTIAQSIHVRFEYGEQAFRITKFVDGQPIPKKTFKPAKGDEISPFVVVEKRA